MESHDNTIDLQDCFANRPPDLDFVFPGLPKGSVGAIIGPGEIGKSFLTLSLAVGVATGFDLCGVVPEGSKTGPVAYLNAEDGDAVLRVRMHSLGQFLDTSVQRKASMHLKVKDLKGEEVWLLDNRGKPNQVAIDRLRRDAEGQRLVILDTLRRYHLGDENSSSQMAHLLAILEGIAAKDGPAFLFNHHPSKVATVSGNGREQSAGRGSSVLVDNARFQINLTKMTIAEAKKLKVEVENVEKLVKLTTSKSNYSKAVEDCWLCRNDGGILTRAHLAEFRKPVKFTNIRTTDRCDGDC